MSEFENGIYGMIPRQEWLDVGGPEMAIRANDPVDRIMGDDRTDNITAAWQTIADEYRVPLAAQFHSFDTQSMKTIRMPFEQKSIEKGLIKTKINMSERMREVAKNGTMQSQSMADFVIKEGVKLVEEVFTKSKAAKNEVLATGKLAIKENDIDLTIDYGIPEAQRTIHLDFSQNADIPAQIKNIVRTAKGKGTTLTGLYTSSANIAKMAENTALQKAIKGVYGVGATLDDDEVYNWLRKQGITEVITNDLIYGKNYHLDPTTGRPVIENERMYPEDKMTFYATNTRGEVGIGLFGDPPEVTNDLMVTTTEQSVTPYVYVYQWKEDDPAELWTKASALFIPVLFNPSSIYIATVESDILENVTVTPMDGAATPFGSTTVSQMQSNITVLGNKSINGTLNFISGGLADSGPLAGDGYFLALHFGNIDPNATSVKVGLDPSAGTGLVELDPADYDAVFKITNKNTQVLKVVSTDGEHIETQEFDLSGLVLSAAAAESTIRV